METTSLLRLNELHPLIRQSAIDAYNEAVKSTPVGVHPFITQTYRSFAESDTLYAQGRTTPGEIVTNSKAGQSYHNYALALDFNLQINGKDSWNVDDNWMKVVNIFKKFGFQWGGDWNNFKDYPHLEKKLGYNWRDLLVKHNAGNFIGNTAFLNITDNSNLA